MSIAMPHLTRRSLLVGAAPAIAGGLTALGLAPAVLAQQSGPAARPALAETKKVWSAEYSAKKGQVSLYIFRKRPGEPQAGQPALPILFLAHGSSVSSRPTFDLVPGHGEYSLMDKFAGYGFDVWNVLSTPSFRQDKKKLAVRSSKNDKSEICSNT